MNIRFGPEHAGGISGPEGLQFEFFRIETGTRFGRRGKWALAPAGAAAAEAPEEQPREPIVA